MFTFCNLHYQKLRFAQKESYAEEVYEPTSAGDVCQDVSLKGGTLQARGGEGGEEGGGEGERN